MSSQDSLAAGLEAHGVKSTIETNTEDDVKHDVDETENVVNPTLPAAKHLLVQSEEDRLNYNPLDAGVLVDSTKVIGQNSIKVTGQFILGISAAFMVWDAIDLGLTMRDLVRRQGSRAAKTLRDKAELLDLALRETVAVYCIEMPI